MQERDSIQQVLAAYEGDMTSAPNQMQQLQQRRIEAAEKSASEMREMVKKLELELNQMRGGAVMSRGLEALQEKLQVNINPEQHCIHLKKTCKINCLTFSLFLYNKNS